MDNKSVIAAKNALLWCKATKQRKSNFEYSVKLCQGALSRAVKGKLNISLETAFLIAEKLGISVEELCSPDFFSKLELEQRRKIINEKYAEIERLNNEIKELENADKQ